MFGRLSGFIFAALLFVSSLLGSIFILFPFMPLAYFAPRAWRHWADRFVGYWLIFPSSMLFFVFGVKFHISGDVIDRNKPALIIMNHRTRLDWLFFWNALYKVDPWLLTTEKISLKSSLKRIPGAGWAMGCGAYIFMNRNYEQDRRILKSMLKYYKDSLVDYQLLFFPEGTDRGQRAAKISDEFADRNNLPRYEFLLHPRTTGFNFILNKMLENKYIENIYDVTVGYSHRIVPSELDLLRDGKFPQAVHFDVRKYDVSDVLAETDFIPSSASLASPPNSRRRADSEEEEEEESLLVEDDNKHPKKSTVSSSPSGGSDLDSMRMGGEVDASRWLNALWRDKEERLRRFYNETANPDERSFEPSRKAYRWPVATQGVAYYIAFGFWLFFSAFWTYWLVVSTWVQLYTLVAILFYAWAERRSGGVEFLALEWFYGREMFPSSFASTPNLNHPTTLPHRSE